MEITYTARQSRRRRRFLRAVSVVAGLAAGLLAAEGLLRLCGIKPPSPPIGDPHLGFDQPIGLVTHRNFAEYGGDFEIRTNSLGFNEDFETKIVKSPGSTRIIVVGDSQTVGVCPNHDSWPHRLQQALNQARPDAVNEVINAASGRYSPFQYYAKAAHKLIALEPDVLIVGIYVGNDYVDLLRQDDRPYLTIDSNGLPIKHRPRFILYRDPDGNGSLLASCRVYALLRSSLGPELRYVLSRARILAETVRWNQQSLLAMPSYMWDVQRLNRACPGLATQSLMQSAWFHRFPETLPAARQVMMHVLAMMRDLCRERGMNLLCVIIPTKLQVEQEELAPLLTRVARSDRKLDLAATLGLEGRITEATASDLDSLGIAFVVLRDEMIAHKRGRSLYYPEDLHLSPDGNAVIGEILADHLLQIEPATTRESLSRP